MEKGVKKSMICTKWAFSNRFDFISSLLDKKVDHDDRVSALKSSFVVRHLLSWGKCFFSAAFAAEHEGDRASGEEEQAARPTGGVPATEVGGGDKRIGRVS